MDDDGDVGRSSFATLRFLEVLGSNQAIAPPPSGKAYTPHLENATNLKKTSRCATDFVQNSQLPIKLTTSIVSQSATSDVELISVFLCPKAVKLILQSPDSSTSPIATSF